ALAHARGPGGRCKATDRLGDQMTQARRAREKARVLRGFPDGRPHDDAASREAPHTMPPYPEPQRATVGGWSGRASRARAFVRHPTTPPIMTDRLAPWRGRERWPGPPRWSSAGRLASTGQAH